MTLEMDLETLRTAELKEAFDEFVQLAHDFYVLEDWRGGG